MAKAIAEPLHQTILLADIEGSGTSDDVVRRVRRHHMYEAVQYALEAAEVQRTDQRLEDRGDGVMTLVSPLVPKSALLRALLTEVPTQLHGYNRVAADSAQVRLRMVLAAGEVAPHEIPGVLGGVYGWDLDQAFRLLDGEPLRRALRHRRAVGKDGQDVVICVSEAVYQGVVRHDHRGIRRDAFHEVRVPGKEGPVRGWLYGEPAPDDAAEPAPDDAAEPAPDDAAEPAPDDAAEPAPDDAAEPDPGEVGPKKSWGGPALTFHSGAPTFGGGLVAGDQHGVSGGRVAGDVVMGDKIIGGGNGGGRS
ncbi:hypothetical protein [Streptomyces sp. NBC_01803]|uniref:hypothetical protein n=1 Tax=Streptomyces sp. NBC_01803 TaxID=2975946 RepID=UPI002DDB8C80|nr:hypothetical protein [Streptomyces sp. NBC_01803]WSA45533.1 hypothetical protein OIE51_15800 [Streptomyces sp. NBC_01803]